MTRPLSELQLVQTLLSRGLSENRISEQTGIPRRTVYDWKNKGRQSLGDGECPRCGIVRLDASSYSYLLGLYLGDGLLTLKQRGIYRLRFFLDDRYPGIQAECSAAIQSIRPHHPWVPLRSPRRGCTEISADWKHWICLFPQYGRGRKHRRTIELQDWQFDIVTLCPGTFLRGLIHSDGCRFRQASAGRPTVTRYQFTNRSPQILEIFAAACRLYGVTCTISRNNKASVTRREDVKKLDLSVGPKT